MGTWCIEHHSLVFCDDSDGGMWGEEDQEGGYICIQIAVSLHCTAEINTTLESNYTSVKKERMK